MLQGLNLEVPAGTSCAIVGTSGSGKSTLMRLLFRMFDSTKGTIRVNGADIKEVKLSHPQNAIKPGACCEVWRMALRLLYMGCVFYIPCESQWWTSVGSGSCDLILSICQMKKAAEDDGCVEKAHR